MTIFLTVHTVSSNSSLPYLFQFRLPSPLTPPVPFCCFLLFIFILPTPLPWLSGQVLPCQWTPAAAILGGKRDAKGLAEEHLSLGSLGQRKELTGQFAYAFIPFHTLRANTLWKVPSQFPPRGS